MTITPLRGLQLFQLLRQGTVILTSILLAKSGLSTEVIGVYEKLKYIGYTLSFFWITGLVQGLLTSYGEKEADERPAYLFNAYLVFVLISVLLTAVAWSLEVPLLTLLTGQGGLDYFHLYLLFLLVNLPTFLLENIFLLFRNGKAILWFGLLSFGGQMAVMTGPVLWGMDFRISFVALLVLGGIKHLWLALVVAQHGRAEVRWEMIRSWTWLSFPLMLYALVGGSMQTFDNWLVNYWFEGDARLFALFTYGARELPIALALAGATSTALLPELASDLDQGLHTLKDKATQLAHWLFPLSAGLLLTSDWFFPRVFNPEFSDSAILFNTFLLILSSRLIFSRTILIALKDNRTVLWFSLLELVVNIFLSTLLIGKLGLLGVAIGTVAAYLIEKLLISGFLYWKYHIGPSRYLHLGWWSFYSCLLLGCYLWNTLAGL